MNRTADGNNAKQRFPLDKAFRWFRVLFVGWWALTMLLVVVVAIVRSSEEAFDWTTFGGGLAIGLVGLPFGLFILGRIRRALDRTAGKAIAMDGDAGGPLKQAEEKRVSRLTERMLTGGFGLILLCAGALGLITGRVFESAGPRDAPISARILGGIFALAGALVLSAAFSRKETEDDKRSKEPRA